MPTRILYILTLVLFTSKIFAQENHDLFAKILKDFKNSILHPLYGRINDSVTPSSLYKTEQFNVSISENPIAFDTFHLVVTNPYYSDDFEDYEENYINYPVSYSVIHDNKLISLFRNGKFVCHNLQGMIRDLDLEKKLNSKKFKYHWLINDKLTALSGGSIYFWDNNKWSKLQSPFPLRKQSLLFEDKDFIVFNDCSGEWGGTVYFYDKVTKHFHYTESTCANTVYKKEDRYFVLANLGHMFGMSELKRIGDPRKLPKAKKSEINKIKNGQALGYGDKTGAAQKILDFYRIQLFSSFKYGEKQIYLVHFNELTFLAEIKGTEIEIVHPLFNNEIYTHNPNTKTYGKYTLINLALYATALDKEVSVIIINDNKITKLDWNENQSR